MNAAAPSMVCSSLNIRADRDLLVDFTWQHAPGGIAWVVGNNGSGKSSLLRVLAGWQAPTSGSVKWAGIGRGPVRYLNPQMNAGADLRVADFLALIRSLVVEPAAADVAEVYPESVNDTKRFGQLSTGEAKRILLWALLLGTGPLLLDEPYEHLSRDAKAALTRVLEARAMKDVVIVATNQEVPVQGASVVLTFNGDRIEVIRAT